MALTIGTQLGSHEITALLGKGGMGEVYRARDLKLKREVAIKILPEEFSRNADRVSRFQREAEVLASLNHPNIAAIHNLEETDGTRYLVLELVEGETLADRIARMPIPVEEALGIAIQICEALEAAHERGIVHRDLKPANVKITPDGKIKVLDFGLAKAMESTPASATLSNSPTMLSGTMGGVILGTAAYMSPEQAKGLQADARSDVFSFGCVLYEMLTGRQVFRGDTAAEVLASVLVRDADLKLLPDNLNPRLYDLVHRCLEKNSKRRWQATGDLRAELETIAAAPENGARQFATRSLWRRAIPVTITAIFFAIIGIIAGVNFQRRAPAEVTRFSYALPGARPFVASAVALAAISPDGSRFAYTSDGQLFVRSMADFDGRPIAGAGERYSPARGPFFSPDGQWIGFWAQTESSLKKIAVSGGTAVTLCKFEGALNGATWQGDQIIFAGGTAIMRVPANGGTPEVIARIDPSETAYSPQIIGGRFLLFSLLRAPSSANLPRTTDFDNSQIVLQSLNSGVRKVIFRGGRYAQYLPTGHLVYGARSALMAIPLDPNSGDIQGGPAAVLDGVGIAPFSFSANGTLLYIPDSSMAGSGNPMLRMITLGDRTGKVENLPLSPNAYLQPRISPDGTQLAFAMDDGKDASISIYDLKRGGAPRRLTFEGRNLYPIWTPDSRFITYQSDRDGNHGLFQQRADGGSAPVRITTATEDGSHTPGAWSSEGKTLVFMVSGTGTRTSESGVWTISMDGERKPRAFIQNSSSLRAYNANFSPDNHWLAYSAAPGLNAPPQLFIQPFPATGARFQVPGRIGANIAWSRNGKEIFYDVGGVNVMNAEVRTSPDGTSLSFGNPIPISLPGLVNVSPALRNYDPTPDGRQFVFVRNAANTDDRPGNQPTPQFNIVLNWFTELQQRVPVK
jgi:serine/threonine-protein kinase